MFIPFSQTAPPLTGDLIQPASSFQKGVLKPMLLFIILLKAPKALYLATLFALLAENLAAGQSAPVRVAAAGIEIGRWCATCRTQKRKLLRGFRGRVYGDGIGV